MRMTPAAAQPAFSAAPQSGAQRLAANLPRLREDRGLSQTDLAHALGWTLATIAAIEAGGGAELTLDEIDALCQVLEATPLALFAPVV